MALLFGEDLTARESVVFELVGEEEPWLNKGNGGKAEAFVVEDTDKSGCILAPAVEGLGPNKPLVFDLFGGDCRTIGSLRGSSN